MRKVTDDDRRRALKTLQRIFYDWDIGDSLKFDDAFLLDTISDAFLVIEIQLGYRTANLDDQVEGFDEPRKLAPVQYWREIGDVMSNLGGDGTLADAVAMDMLDRLMVYMEKKYKDDEWYENEEWYEDGEA